MILSFILSATLAWSETAFHCVAKLKIAGKEQSVKLQQTEQGFLLDSSEFNKTFLMKKSSHEVIFEYKNYSKNQKNFLTYSIKCPINSLNCQGEFHSVYNEKETTRPLTEQITSRSTIYLDGNKSVLEVSKEKKYFNLTFLEFERKESVSPIQFGCSL
jgi:hypothetical protein